MLSECIRQPITLEVYTTNVLGKHGKNHYIGVRPSPGRHLSLKARQRCKVHASRRLSARYSVDANCVNIVPEPGLSNNNRVLGGRDVSLASASLCRPFKSQYTNNCLDTSRSQTFSCNLPSMIPTQRQTESILSYHYIVMQLILCWPVCKLGRVLKVCMRHTPIPEIFVPKYQLVDTKKVTNNRESAHTK